MIKKTINNKILLHKTEVTIAESDKEFDEAIKDLNKIKDINCDRTYNDIRWLCSWSNITNRWYITVNWFDVAGIAHEVVHLIFQLFDSRRIPTRSENDEIFWYHMTFYMDEILGMYIKKKQANALK